MPAEDRRGSTRATPQCRAPFRDSQQVFGYHRLPVSGGIPPLVKNRHPVGTAGMPILSSVALRGGP